MSPPSATPGSTWSKVRPWRWTSAGRARPSLKTSTTGSASSPLDASISSIVRRETQRELVNGDAVLGMNAYVFDRYGTSTKVDHLSGRVFSRQLDLIAERVTGENGVVVRRETSELGESMTVDIRAPGCSRLLSTITTWREVPRVDIRNRMFKLRTVDKQSVFFAFPFAATSPELVYELPGGATSADAPTVPGCPQHMRAIRNWVALAEDRGGTAWAAVDAPLVQFGDIHSPYTPFPGTLRLQQPEPGTVYSWALNNIWDTNFPTEQGGEMNFRYAISSQETGDARTLGMRLGEAVSTPLVGTVVPTAKVPAANGGHEMGPSGSLCVIERPEVRLVQATASEREGDLLLWLNNLSTGAVTTGIDFPDMPVRAARWGNVFEGSQDSVAVVGGSVHISLAPGETKALTLELARKSPS